MTCTLYVLYTSVQSKLPRAENVSVPYIRYTFRADATKIQIRILHHCCETLGNIAKVHFSVGLFRSKEVYRC